MKILIIDNYDSFTYNIVQYVEEIIDQKVDIYRNDEISLEEINKYDKIILSPGPGVPNEAGILKDVIKKYAPSKSILGICLGLQAMSEVYGGKIKNLSDVYHGVASKMTIQYPDNKLFLDIPQQFEAGRYHSWIVDKDKLPDCFTVSSIDEDGQIMSMFHKEYDLRGVQFHPESILTPYGKKMLKNWIDA